MPALTLADLLKDAKNHTLDIFPPGTVAQVEKRLEALRLMPSVS